VIEELLTAHQREVMNRVIAEEEARRRHLVIALSGAHAYGFPSPDSCCRSPFLVIPRSLHLG
jgi:hypothetical protein